MEVLLRHGGANLSARGGFDHWQVLTEADVAPHLLIATRGARWVVDAPVRGFRAGRSRALGVNSGALLVPKLRFTLADRLGRDGQRAVRCCRCHERAVPRPERSDLFPDGRGASAQPSPLWASAHWGCDIPGDDRTADPRPHDDMRAATEAGQSQRRGAGLAIRQGEVRWAPQRRRDRRLARRRTAITCSHDDLRDFAMWASFTGASRRTRSSESRTPSSPTPTWTAARLTRSFNATSRARSTSRFAVRRSAGSRGCARPCCPRR